MMFELIYTILACTILIIFSIYWLIHCINNDKYRKLQEELYNERYFYFLDMIDDHLNDINETLNNKLK